MAFHFLIPRPTKFDKLESKTWQLNCQVQLHKTIQKAAANNFKLYAYKLAYDYFDYTVEQKKQFRRFSKVDKFNAIFRFVILS